MISGSIRGINYICITFLILLPTIGFAQAQSGRLRGIVYDKANHEPLSFVTVSIRSLGLGGFTDSNGRFSINGVPIGTHKVIFSSVGYIEKVKEVSIEGSEVYVEINLSESVENLNEITVYGESDEIIEAKKVMQKVMPVTVITSKDFENRASNLNELLTRQAGVQIRRSGGFGSSATISVRGLEGKRVQVFLDGNPVNTPDGSFGVNDVPLQLIERVEIYKGTIPANLGGDGLGSAVNVITKHRDFSYVDANIARQSFNTTNSGLILKKVFEKSGVESGVGIFDNRSDNDFVMQSPFQEALEVKRNHDRFRNTLAGASIRFHKLWFDQIEIEAAHNDVFKEFQGIQRNIQHVETTAKTSVISGKLEKSDLLSGKLDIKANAVMLFIKSTFTDTSSFAYNWDGSRSPSLTGRGELGIGPNLSNTEQDEFRTRMNVGYRINSNVSLNLNHTFRKSYFNPQDDMGNAFAGRNIYNYDGRLRSSVIGFTVESNFLEGRLLMSSAIKHYYNLVTGFNTNIYVQGDPDRVSHTIGKMGYNVGLRYNLTSALFLKASHEFAVRLPLASELFGDGALITPSINLNPEEAHNYSTGLVYDKYFPQQRRLQLETNIFYMEVDHLIQLAGSGLTTGYINYAKARITGLDVDWKYDLTHNFYLSYNATWQSIRDVNRFIPGTNDVRNPTYRKQIPNIPTLFSNWSVEYHVDNLLGEGSGTRIIYEGSHVHEYGYGFELSINDDFIIPTALAHNIIIEQSFLDQQFTITGQVQNLANAIVINNWNQPLPGRSFRLKLRYLLINKNSKN